MKSQDLTLFVANNLSQLLKNHAQKSGFKSQKDLEENLKLKKIEIKQSILSRLWNATYQIKNSENKIFIKISEYFELNNKQLWIDLSQGFEETLLSNEDEEKLCVGLTSFALWTAPIWHALSDSFPDWLKLTYKRTAIKNDGSFEPVWVDSNNYKTTLLSGLSNYNTSSPNPFQEFITSGTLPDMLLHPLKKEDNRVLHAIFCPDQTIEAISEKQKGGFYTLDDGNELVKVAKIIDGYGGLVCLIERFEQKIDSPEIIVKKEDETIGDAVEKQSNLIASVEDKGEKSAEQEEEFTREDEAVGYKIIHHRLNDTELKDEGEKNRTFYEFLGLLKNNNNIVPFAVRGIKGAAIYDSFKDLLKIKYENEKEETNKKIIHYLMKRRDTLDFNKDIDGVNFKQAGKALLDGQKLVIVGYEPLMHNLFQTIRRLQSENFEGVKFKLHRFNFSQWMGTTSCSLYMTKEHFTINNFKKVNSFLEKMVLKSAKKAVSSNDILPRYYYIQDNEYSINEANSLYEIACKEMNLDKPITITYSTSLIQLVSVPED